MSKFKIIIDVDSKFKHIKEMYLAVQEFAIMLESEGDVVESFEIDKIEAKEIKL